MARPGKQIDGLKVARARAAAGFRTQTSFADRLGIHWTTMNRIENGRAAVSLELIEKIAAVTGKPRDHFLIADEDEELAPVDTEPSIAEMIEALLARVAGAQVKAELQQQRESQERVA